MTLTLPLTFGPLLKYLRKRAGMTQGDLAAALGYSIALISSLEKAQRRPDLQAVTERFIPALGLHDDPATATHLIEQAAMARRHSPRAIAAARLARQKLTLGHEYGFFSDCDFNLGVTLYAFAHELVERVGFDQATPLLRECQEIFRQRENHYLMNYVLGTMGRLAFLKNDRAQAHVYLQEAAPLPSHSTIVN